MSEDSNETSVQSVVHTPGPWVVRKCNPSSHGYLFGFHIGNSEQRTTVCEVVNEHDAKLIAAAPMMLQALQQCLRNIESDEFTHGRNFAAGNVARDAIEKATGVRPAEVTITPRITKPPQ